MQITQLHQRLEVTEGLRATLEEEVGRLNEELRRQLCDTEELKETLEEGIAWIEQDCAEKARQLSLLQHDAQTTSQLRDEMAALRAEAEEERRLHAELQAREQALTDKLNVLQVCKALRPPAIYAVARCRR